MLIPLHSTLIAGVVLYFEEPEEPALVTQTEIRFAEKARVEYERRDPFSLSLHLWGLELIE